MGQKRFGWGIALACAIAVSTTFVVAGGSVGPGTPAAESKTAITHTVTWWCVDLNDLWKVKVPVIVGRPTLQPPDPSPIPDPCTSPFPVAVPEGSAFAPGAILWFTNKTYPPAVRAALQEMGYNFHSQSPAEDFMSKFKDIRVEVRTYPANELVAEHHFDPRQSFRLVRAREYYGAAISFIIGPIVDPALGIEMPIEEVGRLPMLSFPVIIPPAGGPGEYRIWVYWTLSDWHNDGTCLEEGCMLPAGEFLYAAPRFTIVP